MEFDKTLSTVQSILVNINTHVVQLESVKHRGGNEAIIERICKDFLQALKVEGLIQIENDQCVPLDVVNLRNIILCIILNTNSETAPVLSNCEDYDHLVNCFPRVSKLVLTDIVWSLRLWNVYSDILVNCVSLESHSELLKSVISNVKRSELSDQIEQAIIFIDGIYARMFILMHEFTESEIVKGTELLQSLYRSLVELTTILKNTKDADNLSKDELCEFWGILIIKVLTLVKNINNSRVTTYQKLLIRTVQRCDIILFSTVENIVKEVSVTMFLFWSEVYRGDITLQQAVGESAYEAIEFIKDMDLKEAQTLVSVMKQIARKPLSLEERIAAADVDLVRRNCNEILNKNRVLWFNELVRRGEFTRNDLKTYLQLCQSEETILNILNWGFDREQDDWDVALLCASQLFPDQINNVVQKYLINHQDSKHGTHFNSKLTEVLNQVGIENCVVDIYLLILQDCKTTTKYLLQEALKGPETLLETIQSVQPLLKSTTELIEILEDYDLDLVAPKRVSLLLNILKVDDNLLWSKINTQDVKRKIFYLTVLYETLDKNKECPNPEEKINHISEILKCHRWVLTSFSWDNVKVVQLCISIIKTIFSVQEDDIHTRVCTSEYIQQNLKDLSPADKYYLRNSKDNIVSYILPEFGKLPGHGAKVFHLSKLLVSSVPEEWEAITLSLMKSIKPVETLTLLIDCLIMLSNIAKSTSDNSVLSCMEYSAGRLGVAIKNIISGYPLDFNEHKDIAQRLCILLKNLPESTQMTCGLMLVNLLDSSVLQKLEKDSDASFIGFLNQMSGTAVENVIREKLNS